MGTPGFAVAPLQAILESGYKVAAVVTVPDKPAGRGQTLHQSAVKKYALEKGLPVLQPENLKSPGFIEQLQSFDANLQVVVAFRMLPQVIWSMPPLGTFNLHASLLPQYRGAAPINWAIINGETETGVTTFFLDEKIDTGKIILQEKVQILPQDNLEILYVKLMHSGSELVVKTLKSIENGTISPLDQHQFYSSEISLKTAPKIFKNDCEINWNTTSEQIHNLVRGLNPVPGAFTSLISSEGKVLNLKIFKTRPQKDKKNGLPGDIQTDCSTFLEILTSDGSILIDELQLEGKKRMLTSDFLRGFAKIDDWKLLS